MAIEAVSIKRLSDSNFASGWIPLIYDGKESQSVAVSPEMPWQVNCILSLLTNSKDLCARTHARTAYRGARFSSGMTIIFFFFFLFSRKLSCKLTGANSCWSWRADLARLWRNHPAHVHVSRQLADWALRKQVTQKSVSFLPTGRAVLLMFILGLWNVTSLLLFFWTFSFSKYQQVVELEADSHTGWFWTVCSAAVMRNSGDLTGL